MKAGRQVWNRAGIGSKNKVVKAAKSTTVYNNIIFIVVDKSNTRVVYRLAAEEEMKE